MTRQVMIAFCPLSERHPDWTPITDEPILLTAPEKGTRNIVGYGVNLPNAYFKLPPTGKPPAKLKNLPNIS
jgi:hypothetical protein